MNDDTGTTRTTTPPAPSPSPRTVQHHVVHQDDTSTEEEDSTGPTGMDLLDNDADAQAVHLSNDDMTLLRKLCLLGKEAALGLNLLTCAHLDTAPTPDTINDWFSVVVGDAFHVMDQAKVPMQHEAKKTYFVALRDVILQFDPDQLKEVKSAVKEKDGKTDNEIDTDIYFNLAFWKACVRRRILPPRLLYQRIRAVFVSFGNMIDSRSKKLLFKLAWKKANNILKEVLLGYYSDPPGYSFYSTKYNKRGEPMVNAYGFDILCCRRGTNDVENTHKLLLTIFGTWHIGIEMSDCLLRERRHHHNQRCSELCRLGFPRIGHFDTWKIDAQQNLVLANHGVLLHPNWVNSSNFKNTPETFGTITLHDAELADALSNIPIDKNVRLTHDMQYLCRVMGTKLPLLPIHTVAERQLFSQLVLLDTFDARKMALEWVKSVDGVNIYPKLPVHLQNYRVTFNRNARTRQAFADAQESREILAALNEALCPEIEGVDGTDVQDTPQQLDTYTRQWPPICPPPPLLLPLAPSAMQLRNIHVGCVLIDKTPEVSTIYLNRKRRRRERGPDARPRPRRRCMVCKEKGETAYKYYRHCVTMLLSYEVVAMIDGRQYCNQTYS